MSSGADSIATSEKATPNDGVAFFRDRDMTCEPICCADAYKPCQLIK